MSPFRHLRKINKRVLTALRSYGTNLLTTVSEKNGVRRITLNNPKKRNALSLNMLEGLKENITYNLDDDTLRCIVISSIGPVFSSGHDLKELKESSVERRTLIFERCTQVILGIQKSPVPVIAQVQGIAAAAGCQLIASCDIVLASRNSQFSVPGASVGLFCSTPGVAVSRSVPQKLAAYMLFTGHSIGAEEALQSGLVSKICPEDELESLTDEVVRAIVAKSRSVLQLGKEFFYQQLNKDVETAYRIGSQVMVDNLAKEDAAEGITAFFEKRQPTWTHK